jgi:hypothetical protein
VAGQVRDACDNLAAPVLDDLLRLVAKYRARELQVTFVLTEVRWI